MDWDYVIVGSGFGGSVSALRLSQKGYRVAVLEQGRRLGAEAFPRSNWNLWRWLWMPGLGMRGLFRMTFFRHLTALSGVGVGGGSLVYANTLPTPGDDFFEAESWRGLASWKAELEPHYAEARRMLGVARNPLLKAPEDLLRQVAEERGQAHAYSPTDVAVFFGEAGVTVKDPYFGGEGPDRAGCIGCGGCMIGCRHNAKNTLDKNYLFLAEKLGAVVHPDTEVTWVRPEAGGGYRITARVGASVLPFRRKTTSLTARHVIFSGGVMGTVPLLLRLRESPDGLPDLSPRLGHAMRSNSEALIGVVSTRRDLDLSEGIAIGSILKTDPHSHLELVRYSAGSGFFRTLMAPHVAASSIPMRLAQMLGTALGHPWLTLRTLLVPDWARYTTIMLYMRTLDGTLRLQLGRALSTLFRRALVTRLDEGQPPSASIPEATELAHQIASRLRGLPMSLLNEAMLNIPTTAHVLGGCCMGEEASRGVIDQRHRLFGYPGLFVVDGSAISANPGVNPSLTICALAERAMSFIPAANSEKRS